MAKYYRHNICKPVDKYFIVLILSVLAIGCNPTKYVPGDKYLLNKYSIEVEDNKKVDKEELRAYLRQKPNKRILGFMKFHLWLYNLSSENKDKWPHGWLKKIGEKPVIYDPGLQKSSKTQLKLYLGNKGYYNALVEDDIEFTSKNKVNVKYHIKTRKPYRIKNIKYHFEDSSLSYLILQDTINSFIKKEKIFDVDLLEEERGRIESFLRNRGYFNFSSDYIYYEVDSALNNLHVNLDVIVKKFIKKEDEEIVHVPHEKFRVRKVFLFTDYDAREALLKGDNYTSDLDTLKEGNNFFLVYKERIPLKTRSLLQYVYIIPNSLYNVRNVERTYKHLHTLKVFKTVDIKFIETGTYNENGEHLLDCSIQLSPHISQYYTVELEGTNSENYGGGAVFSYGHRNLLKGAENFNFRIRGAIEAISDTSVNLENELEIGAEASLQTPKFLLPFNMEKFVKKYHPKTSITLAASYQKRPDYKRTVTNATFGYFWRGNKFLTHVVNPVELNAVNSFLTPAYEQRIRNHYLYYSYFPHFVSNSSYRLIYTNQEPTITKNFFYIKWKIEAAGAMLSLFNNWTIRNNYEFLGLEYSQYIKTDIDYRNYQVLNSKDRLVFRLFAGIGQPYGNSQGMPYEKKYFAGGPNSMRAWNSRSIGPGILEVDTFFGFFNNVGDMKLEMNLEYRFKIFWKLEGALFTDVGNIWEGIKSPNNTENREGGVFYLDEFYKQLGVASGMGIRFDFSFFIFRLDYAVKMRDPVKIPDSEWLFFERGIKRRDWNIFFGIGYPF
ncbi:MAG: BamA/TamA family outer membrane protein [bacterium]